MITITEWQNQPNVSMNQCSLSWKAQIIFYSLVLLYILNVLYSSGTHLGTMICNDWLLIASS